MLEAKKKKMPKVTITDTGTVIAPHRFALVGLYVMRIAEGV